MKPGRNFAKEINTDKQYKALDNALEALKKMGEALKAAPPKKAWEFKGKKSPGDPARHGHLWSVDENCFVIECIKEGDSAETIARKVERKLTGVLTQLCKLKVLQRDEKLYNRYYLYGTSVVYYENLQTANMLFNQKVNANE